MDERDEWANLVKSPGWQRWVQWATVEAQQSIEAEMARALDNENDQVAAGRMRQAIAGKRMLERAVRYPQDRLKALTEVEPPTIALPPSRRGSL